MSLIQNKDPGPFCKICRKKVQKGQEICSICLEDPELKEKMSHVVSNFHGRRRIGYDGGRVISEEPENY